MVDWAEAEEDKDDSHFWEDNWDDDDIEDDFSKQLRYGILDTGFIVNLLIFTL